MVVCVIDARARKVSPGCFAQDGEMVFVGMFAVLWVMTAVVIATALKMESELRRPEETEDTLHDDF